VKEPLQRYGVTWSVESTPAEIELSMAFDIGGTHEASGFEGAFVHLQRAIDLIWNCKEQLIIWNDWSEKLFHTFIENRESPVTGPAASWKTTCAACYACAFWLAEPLRSKIICSSTSLGALREKLWKDVIRFYRASGCGFGNVINHPTPKIQTEKGNDATGIFGIAVEQGNVDAAVDKIKGRHAPRVLVIIDEGTGAHPAVVEACVNLSTACETYQLSMLANMSSYYNEFGKLAEPVDGWTSVDVEFEGWKTKRGGYCLHLDGHKSPNVLSGKNKYPGLINQSDLDSAAKQYGENSPRYWIERRGFAPPEGIAKTVITGSMIEHYHGRDKAIWAGEWIMCGALDPAFEGGDRRPLRFFKVGEIAAGDKPEWTPQIDLADHGEQATTWALEFIETILLRVDVKGLIHHQIAKQVIETCKSKGVAPRYFGLDVTGEGGGVADILKRDWSGEILCVEFGGNASKRPVSDTNPRPSIEEYVNRVTELWFQLRVAMKNGHIRGLDEETCVELTMRECDYTKYSPRVKIQSKEEMKGLRGKSPDLADAAVVAVEVARERIKGFVLTGEGRVVEDRRWDDYKEKYDVNMTTEEEMYVAQPVEDSW
jgi:hypothetical protein